MKESIIIQTWTPPFRTGVGGCVDSVVDLESNFVCLCHSERAAEIVCKALNYWMTTSKKEDKV